METYKKVQLLILIVHRQLRVTIICEFLNFFLNIEKNQDGLLVNFLGTRPQTETESSTSRLLLSKYHPLHRYSQRRITWPVPPPGYYFSSTTQYTGTVSTGQHDRPHLLATTFQVLPTTQVQSAQDNMTGSTCRLLLSKYQPLPHCNTLQVM